jgi:hypothetical protein
MSEDLLFHMCDVACVRAWEDEGWGPYHKRLLLMCNKLENPGRRKSTGMTREKKILNHLTKARSITIREAMDDYNMSGGSLTKGISILRAMGYPIQRTFHAHPVTGQRYARYTLLQREAA